MTMWRLLLAASTPLCVLAVRRLDLTASEGETAGKYAFEGGENEATCKACKAVMEHMSREMAKPMYDETNYYAGRKTRVAGSRTEQAHKLNRASRISAVLDPSKCMEAMKKYDLAFVGGANNFQFKGEGEAGTNYPVHMELNEWAKHELGMYCESLFEEKEDELTAAVIAAEVGGSKTLADAICKEELDLCHPPRPPPPPPPGSEPKLSKAERMKKAKEVFESMDNNSDGFVDKREIQGRMKNAQREGKLSASTTVKAEVARFFAVDANGDGKVSFDEYKVMWTPKKKKKGSRDAAADEPADPSFMGQARRLYATLVRLGESAREYARESPYVALSGVGIMSACVYVGGMVVRVW